MYTEERNKLIEDNMGLVREVIRANVNNVYGIGIFDYNDLFQIGCIGLCKAVDSYRASGSFSTYAYVIIRNEIFNALEYATLRRTREIISDTPGEAKSTEAPGVTFYEINNLLDSALDSAGGITAKGIKAIRMLAAGYSHREIGEIMGGASANNVTAWVARARKYLRTQPEIASLKNTI